MEDKLIYITVPYQYEGIYSAMLVAATHYGELALKECKCQCDDKYCTLMECFNLFHSVIAAYTQQQEKLADTIAKYIIAKLNSIGIKVDTSISNIILVTFIGSTGRNILVQNAKSVPAYKMGDVYSFTYDIDNLKSIAIESPTDYYIKSVYVIDNNIESDISDNISNDGGFFNFITNSAFDKGTKLKLVLSK